MIRRSALHRWHRRIGITTALFVLMLAVTGWLLNHTERFNLAEVYVSSQLLLDWYGINPKNPPLSFAVDGHRVTQVDTHLYFDDQRISTSLNQLIGVVKTDGIYVVAAEDSLYLLQESGQLIEKLDNTAGVPAGMHAIGMNDENQFMIHAAHGIYTTDLNKLDWKHTETGDVSWSQSSPAPQAHLDAVLGQFRGSGLSYERVLLDLHSGRLLGQGGVLLIDLAALLFAALAVTGCIIWWYRY